MARLHSKKRGKAGTKRPKAKVPPQWLSAKPGELGEAILRMRAEGMPPSRIAMALRDTYGVPDVKLVFGMSLGAFLRKENALPEYPEDFLALIKRAVRMKNHMKKNKKDAHNKVKLMHVESKINRLVKYYIRVGRLPVGWKYNQEQAALLVK